jgi:guanine deaminase
MDHSIFLKRAVDIARKSVDLGGFPDGALVVKNGELVTEGLSLGFLQNDPTGHAESCAIRSACKELGTVDLSSCVLYASLQPCLMCFSATTWANIGKIVYGCQKTADMVKKGYYEGISDVSEINKLNTHKIELIYVSDFEEDMKKLIAGWEANS